MTLGRRLAFVLVVPCIALATPTAFADDEDDDDRTEFLFFGGELGYGSANLRMIEYSELLPSVVEKKGSGTTFGVHGFVRILFVAVGLRAQVLQLDDYDIWHMNLEGQLRLPASLLEIYLRLGLGYAFLGTDFQGEDPSINGWDGQLGVGLDVFLADWLSLGPALDVTVLNLTRSAGLTEVELGEEGSAAGLAFHIAGVLSLRL